MINTEHPCLTVPSTDMELRRYMSFDKFEAMLRDKALFFCRADRFSDPFEGSIPRREAESRDKKQTGERKEVNIAGLRSTHINFKIANVVNCWQIAEHENDAMWRLYLKSNMGLAIKSSIASIRREPLLFFSPSLSGARCF